MPTGILPFFKDVSREVSFSAYLSPVFQLWISFLNLAATVLMRSTLLAGNLDRLFMSLIVLVTSAHGAREASSTSMPGIVSAPVAKAAAADMTFLAAPENSPDLMLAISRLKLLTAPIRVSMQLCGICTTGLKLGPEPAAAAPAGR